MTNSVGRLRVGLPVWLRVAAVVAVFALAFPSGAFAQTGPTVVAQGLNNPRGLAFGPQGALYIAEAGLGGAGPCLPGPEGLACFGTTGSITRVQGGTQERVATGLPSMAGAGGFGAAGPHDIGFNGLGNGYFTIGLGNDPRLRSGPLAQMGQLGRLLPNGTWTLQTDVAGYEWPNNPDGNPGAHGIDSNPYGLLVEPGGVVIADAGGNDLLRVNAQGDISTVATFPFVGGYSGMQPVPTAVVKGPDGAYYVSQLTGVPFPVGGANIFRVVPGEAPTVYKSGFTNVVDLTFGPDGNLYVLEIATFGLFSGNPTGALKRINWATGQVSTVIGPGVTSYQLFAPGGVAFGPDGAAYITNGAFIPGGGFVLRVELPAA